MIRSMSDPTKERTGGDHPNYVDVLRTYSEDKVRAIKQSTVNITTSIGGSREKDLS